MDERLKPKPEIVVLFLKNSLLIVCLQRNKIWPVCRNVWGYSKFCLNRSSYGHLVLKGFLKRVFLATILLAVVLCLFLNTFVFFFSDRTICLGR